MTRKPSNTRIQRVKAEREPYSYEVRPEKLIHGSIVKKGKLDKVVNISNRSG